MVGNEWKNLPASVKQSWEDRACKLNEESAAARREWDENCPSPGPNEQQNGLILECCWDKCDYQFEDVADCVEHCIQEGTGHVQRTFNQSQAGESMEYTCLWRNCIRVKKNMQAFPSLLRLVKHVREVHLSKGGKMISQNERSKNFVQRKQPKLSTTLSNNGICGLQLQDSNGILQASLSSPRGVDTQNGLVFGGPPPEPMFVTVPPRPQRVAHSEAYIKYIESLQPTASAATQAAQWKKTLKPATPETINKTNLPVHWLGDYSKNNNGADVVQALCHLRNFMMDDVLKIQRQYF